MPTVPGGACRVCDPDLLFDGPTQASTTIALAHGGGAGMDSPFVEFLAKQFGRTGWLVVRFDYPYMAQGVC